MFSTTLYSRSEGVDESVVGRPANLPPQHKLPRMMTNEDGEIFWCVTRRERKRPYPRARRQGRQGVKKEWTSTPELLLDYAEMKLAGFSSSFEDPKGISIWRSEVLMECL